MKTETKTKRKTNRNAKASMLGAIVAAGCSLLTSAPVNAQSVDCACSGTYAVGDRVVALVDNPWGASSLPAGSTGTVICGTSNVNLQILIRWDNWTFGLPASSISCECGDLSGGAAGDWFVGCSLIDLALVTNTTQATLHTTLQGALDLANTGDAISIGAGTLNEDNIVFPDGIDVTITGAGMDQTIIDGGGAANPNNPILTLGASAVGNPNIVTSDLTLQNGHAASGAGGVLVSNGVNANFARVAFRSNTAQIADVISIHSGTKARLDHCVLAGGSSNWSILTNQQGQVDLVGCLFHDLSGIFTALQASGSAVVNITSCTIAVDPGALALVAQTATIDVNNSILLGGQSGAINRSHCLYSGAPAGNGNIDGAPTFVNESNGDYRLAQGSLGIDAGNYAAYVAAGGTDTDLAGQWRFRDDVGVTDSGVGAFTALDMGAHEYQGQTPVNSCPGDVTGDNMVDLDDLQVLLFNFGNVCP